MQEEMQFSIHPISLASLLWVVVPQIIKLFVNLLVMHNEWLKAN